MDDQAVEMRLLGQVLLNVDQLPWKHALFLEGERPWGENTQTMILDPDDVEDPNTDDEPEVAKQHGLRYGLLVADVVDIVENARAQQPNVTMSELIQAFNYYYDNDAFIEF